MILKMHRLGPRTTWRLTSGFLSLWPGEGGVREISLWRQWECAGRWQWGGGLFWVTTPCVFDQDIWSETVYLPDPRGRCRCSSEAWSRRRTRNAAETRQKRVKNELPTPVYNDWCKHGTPEGSKPAAGSTWVTDHSRLIEGEGRKTAIYKWTSDPWWLWQMELNNPPLPRLLNNTHILPPTQPPPPYTHTQPSKRWGLRLGDYNIWLHGSRLKVHRQTSLIRASLIRMPHNRYTLSGNLFYLFSIYNDSVIRMCHNPNTF